MNTAVTSLEEIRGPPDEAPHSPIIQTQSMKSDITVSEIIGLKEPSAQQSQHIVQKLKDHFYFPIYRKGMPVVFACVFVFSCVYWNSLVQLYIQNLVIQKGMENSAPLFDMGFQLLPYIPLPLLADYYTTIIICAVMLKSFIVKKLTGTLHIYRRLMIILGLCFLLRSISICITLLPNPWVQCKPQITGNYFLGALLIMTGTARTCSDCFFSGHSVMIVLSALVWYTYTDTKFLLLRLLFIPMGTFGALSIVVTHFHYSIDVMYGCLIAIVIWTLYHYVVNMIESWLMDRLYRSYLLYRHSPTSVHKEVSNWELASEFLNYEQEERHVLVYSKKPTSQDENKDHVVIVIQNNDAEEQRNQEFEKSILELSLSRGSLSGELLAKKMIQFKNKIEARGAKRAYYHRLKLFLATAMLMFFVWFESWEDYLEMDFDKAQTSQTTNIDTSPVSVKTEEIVIN
ncbi:sphingomyelin synthase-related protein [Acrasis kona]|uniref:Sphingomyelin synthase-related protein n=1 Tax=Acrasis kona TaxID=1008807 RepID=A0AAW2YKR2_9EUKA